MEKNMISANTYEEVYQILSVMDKDTVMKIPLEILENIKLNRNSNYLTRIDKNDIFNESNVSKETIDILCFFDYHYWMDSNRKSNIDKILSDRKINEEENKKKYSVDNLFEKKEKTILDNTIENNIQLIPIEKNIFDRIWEKIIAFFIKGGKNE